MIGTTTVRVEVFVATTPTRSSSARSMPGANYHDPIRDHQMPWGTHRQGGFIDPFGHIWLVGDESPLSAKPT